MEPAGVESVDVRSHPVAGGFLVLSGVGLVAAGALLPLAPFQGLFMPPEIVVPFVLWQLAIWAILLGFFFLRPRRHAPERRRT